MKTYKHCVEASDDCLKERQNDEYWGSHEYIMPLQASLEHRDIFMTIWPLAKHDLQESLRNHQPKEYSNDHKTAWKRFANLLSALDHIHCGSPDLYGYHFDIKPHNVLVRFDGDWVIADLGFAYSKPSDSSVSKTSRQGGNVRYCGPENPSHRNYDVWSMGCLGCDIMAWLNGGPDGVEQFRIDRLFHQGIFTLEDFHYYGRLKPPVIRLFEEMENHGDDLTKEVAAILREMLEVDPRKRLSAKTAEERFVNMLSMLPPVAEQPSLLQV